MKLPFRSRVAVDEFDIDDLDIDDLDIDDLDVDARHDGDGDHGDLDGGDPLDVESEEGGLRDLDVVDSLDDGAESDGPVPPAVTADEFSNEMERLRSEASAEQRSAWAYLGLLTGLFAGLVIVGYGCSDLRIDEVAGGSGAELATRGQPSQLVFRIDGDIITLEGTVPDEAAKAQLLASAQLSYGSENVIDDLVVDDGSSFEEGTIRVVGSAAFDDGRPKALQDAIGADFGLTNRGFEVGFVETVLAPVNAVVAVADNRIQLSGALPDQQSIDDLVTVGSEIWGAANVDSSLLTIGETTWTDGRIRMTGTALSNDQRIGTFVTLVPERIGALVSVDTSGLTIDDISRLLTEVQTQINALVGDSPIQFAPLSAEIEPDSDPTLVEVANLMAQLPLTPFEVVGHTDNVGNDEENLVLSQDRAQAVVDRLIELGVAGERMSSRGEGEAKPIADNDTDEGKAANRRIEFVLVGTSGG